MGRVAALLSILLAASLAGCVAVDGRASSAKAEGFRVQDLEGVYSNKASYRSEKSGLLGEDQFSEFFNASAKGPDGFSIKLVEAGAVEIAFLRGADPVESRLLKPGQDFAIKRDGTVVLKSTSNCGAGDGPGFGCNTRTLQLFTTRANELAVVDSGNAAGMATIIPMVMHVRFLSLFPRQQPCALTSGCNGP